MWTFMEAFTDFNLKYGFTIIALLYPRRLNFKPKLNYNYVSWEFLKRIKKKKVLKNLIKSLDLKN